MKITVYNFYAKHEFWKPSHSVQTSTSWFLQENVHSVLLFKPKCEPCNKPLIQKLPFPCPSFLLLPVVCPGAALFQETLCAPGPRQAPKPTSPQTPQHCWVELYTHLVRPPLSFHFLLTGPAASLTASLLLASPPSARDTLPSSHPSGFLPSCTSIQRIFCHESCAQG